jgi:hypothetical protein
MRHLGELKYGLKLDALHHIEHPLCSDFDIGNIFNKLEMFSARYSYIIMKHVSSLFLHNIFIVLMCICELTILYFLIYRF